MMGCGGYLETFGAVDDGAEHFQNAGRA